jgi:hypothetical protein
VIELILLQEQLIEIEKNHPHPKSQNLKKNFSRILSLTLHSVYIQAADSAVTQCLT